MSDISFPPNTGGGATGTVTSVAVQAAKGVSATITNPTTAPVITIDLGAIQPTSVVSTGPVSGSNISAAGDIAGNAQSVGGYSLSMLTNSSNQSSGTLPVARLADSGVTAGTYGAAQSLPTFTTDGKGRITGASSIALGSSVVRDAGVGAGQVLLLDSGGKAPLSTVSEALLGAMKFRGFWNASTNVVTYRGVSQGAIPTAAAANEGYYYIVTVSGSTNVSGITDWKVGDWAVSDGTAYGKIDSSDQVNSVAGLMGSITAAQLLNALGASTNALAQLTPASDQLPYFTSGTVAGLTSLTSFGRSFIAAADGNAARSLISAQFYSDKLQAIAALGTPAIGSMVYYTSGTTAALTNTMPFGRALLNVSNGTGLASALASLTPSGQFLRDDGVFAAVGGGGAPGSYASGKFYWMPRVVTTSTTINVRPETFLFPIEIKKAMTLTSLCLYPADAAASPGSMRLGLYSSNNGLPGALLSQTNLASIDAYSVKSVPLIASVQVTPGLYWIAVSSGNSQKMYASQNDLSAAHLVGFTPGDVATASNAIQMGDQSLAYYNNGYPANAGSLISLSMPSLPFLGFVGA